MALNLSSMIDAARSQRNPAGEALSNAMAGNDYKQKMTGEQAAINGVKPDQSWLTKIISGIKMPVA